jgi:hypothetical protein
MASLTLLAFDLHLPFSCQGNLSALKTMAGKLSGVALVNAWEDRRSLTEVTKKLSLELLESTLGAFPDSFAPLGTFGFRAR